MRVIIFAVTFLWVFPFAYQALDVPLLNSLLIHGEPINENISSHRWKRAEEDTVTCNENEYKAKKGNYCCNKCQAGDKVASDCKGPGLATKCTPCDEGTYSDEPNNDMACMSCDTCLEQYDQIVVSHCTKNKNTQCGCPAGHFKQFSGRDFICMECSKCENGTQFWACHDDKDTICTCHHNFFLDPSDNRCVPCSECEEPDCMKHCPPIMTVHVSTGTERIVSIVLGVFMVVIIVGSMSACLVYKVFNKNQPSSSESSETNGQTTVLTPNWCTPLLKTSRYLVGGSLSGAWA